MQIGESIAAPAGSAGSSAGDEDDEQDDTLVKLALHDVYVDPMPFAWYLLRAAGEDRRARANEAGVLLERFTQPVEECRVFWSPGEDEQPGGEQDFRYAMTVYVRIRGGDSSDRERKRLNNLGYPYQAGESAKRNASLRSLRAGWRIRELTDGTLASLHRRARVKPSA